MIEVTILTHMAEGLNVPVYMEKPETAPSRYVLIEKTGSDKVNRLPSSTFAFQSYAESMYEAALLNESVKTAAESLATIDEVAGVKLNSDYNFTDTTTKKYRYQAVFDISHY